MARYEAAEARGIGRFYSAVAAAQESASLYSTLSFDVAVRLRQVESGTGLFNERGKKTLLAGIDFIDEVLKGGANVHKEGFRLSGNIAYLTASNVLERQDRLPATYEELHQLGADYKEVLRQAMEGEPVDPAMIDQAREFFAQIAGQSL